MGCWRPSRLQPLTAATMAAARCGHLPFFIEPLCYALISTQHLPPC